MQWGPYSHLYKIVAEIQLTHLTLLRPVTMIRSSPYDKGTGLQLSAKLPSMQILGPSSRSNQLRLNHWAQCTSQLGSFLSTSVAGSQVGQATTVKAAFYFNAFLFGCSVLIQFCCTIVLFLFTARIDDQSILHLPTNFASTENGFGAFSAWKNTSDIWSLGATASLAPSTPLATMRLRFAAATYGTVFWLTACNNVWIQKSTASNRTMLLKTHI